MTQASDISVCHILSLIEMGLRRYRHLGVNSSAGHSHSEMGWCVLMGAEVKSDVLSVQ